MIEEQYYLLLEIKKNGEDFFVWLWGGVSGWATLISNVGIPKYMHIFFNIQFQKMKKLTDFSFDFYAGCCRI